MVKEFNRGGSRGGRGFDRGGRGGSRGGGRGGRGGPAWEQVANFVVDAAVVMHTAEEFVVVKNANPDRVPIFNRPVYLENKNKIGIVDDVFGPINEFVSVFYDILFTNNVFNF